MTLFDPHKEQWWNAQNKRIAYYMTLRVHYGMGALEAWDMMKRNFSQHHEFFADPIGTLQRAIGRRR